MKKWKLVINNEVEIFDKFLDAFKVFKNTINNHIFASEDAYDKNGLPFSVSSFFYHLQDEGTITDHEIVVHYRLNALLDTFQCEDIAVNKECALKCIKNDISYHGEIEEFEESLDIEINLSKDELKVDITLHDVDITYLKTNAFIFDDENKEYYFKSYQVVTTSDCLENIGKSVDLDMTLTCLYEC